MQNLDYLDLEYRRDELSSLKRDVKTLQQELELLKSENVESSNLAKEIKAIENMDEFAVSNENQSNRVTSEIQQDARIKLDEEVFNLKKEFEEEFDFIRKTFKDMYEKMDVYEMRSTSDQYSSKLERVNMDIKNLDSNIFELGEIIKEDRKTIDIMQETIENLKNPINIYEKIEEVKTRVGFLETAPPIFNRFVKDRLEEMSKVDFKDMQTRVSNMIHLENRFIEQLNAMKTRLSATIFKHGGDIKILDERVKRIENSK